MSRRMNGFLEAAVVLAIVFVFVMPGSAMFINTKTVGDVGSGSAVDMQMSDEGLGRSVIFEDDFESYSDFVLDFPPWTQYDGDGADTYGFMNYDFPNEHYVGSYIIFNPSQTTPPNPPNSEPHSGDKYAACFNAVLPATNDDWLITPLISGSSFDEVSFWAKSITDMYNLERFQVGVSTTGTDPSDFTVISPEPYVEVPTVWTQYTYDISPYSGNGSIYIGIHCVSYDAFVFMIDDFVVTGETGEDTTPPVTTCELSGEMEDDIYVSDVTVYLNATDDMSGVNYTMYKLDDGAWQEYDGPFVVTEDGDHTVYFYSVDNAGNIEETKSCSFTIQHPCPCPIEIEIKNGIGFGVTMVVRNTGEENLTDVNWSLSLSGGIILLGRENNGVIENLPAAEEVTVQCKPIIGFGRVTIDATAGGCAEDTADGFVLLFLVMIR